MTNQVNPRPELLLGVSLGHRLLWILKLMDYAVSKCPFVDYSNGDLNPMEGLPWLQKEDNKKENKDAID